MMLQFRCFRCEGANGSEGCSYCNYTGKLYREDTPELRQYLEQSGLPVIVEPRRIPAVVER